MSRVDRRTQIIDAALTLFAERGFHNTGMDLIAAAVGIRAPSLYNHFSSKQEVITALMVRTVEDLLRTQARAMAGVDDVEEQLRVSMQVHVRFHCEHRDAVRVCDHEINSLQGADRSLVTHLRRDYTARWVAIVREGVKRGIFVAPTPEVMSFALLDMGSGVAEWYRPTGKFTVDELATHYAEMALRLAISKP